MRSLILPEFGDQALARIGPMDIRRWIAGLEERGYAPATIGKAYQIVSRAFRVAVTDGIITRSPCREVKLPKIETPERRFLSPAEVEELADAIEVRYRSLVLTGASAGAGEIAQPCRLPEVEAQPVLKVPISCCRRPATAVRSTGEASSSRAPWLV